jgi:hypothetical protein
MPDGQHVRSTSTGDHGGPPNRIPARRAGSVRRTTTHQCTRPDGLSGPVHVSAAGRDLLTRIDREVTVLDTARIEADAEYETATLNRILSDPPDQALAGLVGTRAYRGFRRVVEKILPGEEASGSVRYQLLDDLPTALMLSGRVLRAAGLGLNMGPAQELPIDICADWAAGGTLLSGLDEQGPPLDFGPLASPLWPEDDELAWHDFGTLPPHATRRHRLLDVWDTAEAVSVACFFRDSCSDAAGRETVVHEYVVHGAVDPVTSQFVSCEATAGPLPYPECPSATISAGRVAGTDVQGLRRRVRGEFVGPRTCTHLNDTLRSMEDVGMLLQVLRRG